MGRDLTNLYVSESFQYLIQQSGSEFQNGLGTKVTGTIDITSQYANVALAANTAAVAISSSFATTASYALSAGVVIVNTGSFMITASALDDTITYTKGDGSTFNTVISSVSQSISASYALTASFAETPTVSGSSGLSGLSGISGLSGLSGTSGSNGTSGLSGLSGANGSNGTSGLSGLSGESGLSGLSGVGISGLSGLSGISGLNGLVPSTGSFLVTASVSLNTITFTKGDATTFPITVDTGSAGGSIRVPNVTLASGSWTYTSSFYQYTYSNANINISTSVDYTPYNTSSYFVLEARIQPYIESSASACIFYSQYLPSNNIIGDLIITTVS